MTRTMVVIDDEFIVVEGIKAMIARSHLDYEIVGWAFDGIAGLELLRRLKPEVVITDIRIPGLDGLSLIETAREFLTGTAFVVISGYTEFEYAQRALSLGVKAYIDKPITIEKVSAVLQKIELEKNQQQKLIQSEINNISYNNNRKQMEGVIDSLLKTDLEAIEQQSKLFLTCLENQSIDIVEFKSRCFQFLCVVAGAYYENKNNLEQPYPISYAEMKELSTKKDIESYVVGKITQLSGKINAQKSGSNHRIILQLLEYINTHYNQPIGLNELAELVKMNPAYLCILFKEEVGVSYIKYLTAVRIKQAKKLLLEGKKIAAVSEMVGYNDYRYFCDIFKRHTGQTPSEFKGSPRRREEPKADII